MSIRLIALNLAGPLLLVLTLVAVGQYWERNPPPAQQVETTR